MADKYKGLVIEIGANTSALSTALNNARKEAQGTTKELRQIGSALKIDPKNLNLLVAQQENYKKKISAAKKELEALRAAESQIGKENMSSEQWVKLQSDIARTEADIKKYDEALEETIRQYKLAESGARDFGNALNAAGDNLQKAGDKIQNAGSKVSGIGGSLTAAVTLPIIGAGAATIKAATDIDSGLTSVRKTVDGTEEQYEQLKQAAIDFSQTNAVGADQMLELDALGAQLGFGIDELQLFGEVASGLDIATDMNAEQGATEMAQFANITRMAHSDIERYASAIVNVGNTMATTESKVSSMSQRIAAAGTQTKMSQADILGWAGAMSSLGIEAEAGGTAFSTTISTIDAAVATGGENLDKFAKIAGKSSEEFAKSWRENSTQAFQELLSGVNSAENMTIALEEMGVEGIRQSDVLKRLAGNTDLVALALKNANDGWDENVALSNEVENRNASLASKFEMLKNKVTKVADQVGEPLADALLDAVDAAEPLIEIVEEGAEAFSKMSKEEQQSVLQNVAMVASIGPLLSIAGKSVSVFGGMVTGVGAATKAFGTFAKGIGEASATGSKLTSVLPGLKGGLIGIGIAAGAAVAAFAISKWKEYEAEVEKTEKAQRSLKDIQGDVADEVGKTAKTIEDSGEKYRNLKDDIYDTGEELRGLLGAAAEATDEFADSMTNVEVDAGTLNAYVGIIEDLTSKESLNREEQEKLNWAVGEYNEITGDNVEVTDAQTGKLSKSTEEIKKNTQAFIHNARAQAYQKLIAADMENLVKIEMTLTDANAELTKAQEDYNKALEDYAKGADPFGWALADADQALRNAKTNVALLEEQQGILNTRINDCTKAMSDEAVAFEESRPVIDRMRDTINSFGEDAQKAMQDTGVDVDALIQKLADSGISVETLRGITTEQWAQMVRDTGGDIDQIIAKIKELDGQQIPPKKVQIDYSDLTDAQKEYGRLKGLLDQPLHGKALISIGAGVLDKPRNAAGGIKIPKHADGGILAKPTLTSIGWVGEAGAEAIIPLDNPNYSRKFARFIAQEMNNTENNNQTVQAIFNGAVFNDDAAIQEAVLDLMELIQRRAGMNRG